MVLKDHAIEGSGNAMGWELVNVIHHLSTLYNSHCDSGYIMVLFCQVIKRSCDFISGRPHVTSPPASFIGHRYFRRKNITFNKRNITKYNVRPRDLRAT